MLARRVAAEALGTLALVFFGAYPGKSYEDWGVDDPAEKGLDEVRAIRDTIDLRVRELLHTLTAEPAGSRLS